MREEDFFFVALSLPEGSGVTLKSRFLRYSFRGIAVWINVVDQWVHGCSMDKPSDLNTCRTWQASMKKTGSRGHPAWPADCPNTMCLTTRDNCGHNLRPAPDHRPDNRFRNT